MCGLLTQTAKYDPKTDMDQYLRSALDSTEFLEPTLNPQDFEGTLLGVCARLRPNMSAPIRELAYTNPPTRQIVIMSSYLSAIWRPYSFRDQPVSMFVSHVRYQALSTSHLVIALCIHLTLNLIGWNAVIRLDSTAKTDGMTWLCWTGPLH